MKCMIAAPLAVAVYAAVGLSTAFAQAPIPGEGETLEQHLAVAAPLPNPAQELSDLAAQRVARYGQIVDAREVGVGNLTAWTVQKNGHQIVLFSTPDAAVIFTGIAWDAASGRNISEAFSVGKVQSLPASRLGAPQAQAALVQPSATLPYASEMPTQERAAAAMDGKYLGEIPESMKTVDSLAGVKEGNGDVADTVYIVIDPRCPYCQQAYNQSRAFIKKGHTIKWIPTAALGNPQDGVPLAATILQSEDPSVLERIFSKHEKIRTQPTPETAKDLSTSLAFLFAAFQNNGREQAGVPAAFFIDHRTGKPRMLTGVSESVVLEDIFGKL